MQNRKIPAVEIYKSIVKLPSLIRSYPSVTSLRKLFLNLNWNRFENLYSFNIFELNKTFEGGIYRMPVELKLFCTLLKCYCEMYDFAKFLINRNNFENLDFLRINEKNFNCKEPLSKIVTHYADNEFISMLNLTDCPEKCACSRRCLEDIQLTNCSSVGLKEIPKIPILVEGLESIELNIEFNNISKITFDKKDTISRMFAANNNIESILNENLPQKLKILDIRNNNFSKLESTFLSNFKDEEILTFLSGNNWTCNCDDQTFREFVAEYPNLVGDNEKVNCWFEGKLYPISSEILLCLFDFIPYVITGLVFLLVVISIISLFLIFKLEIKVWLFAHNLFLC